jgi:magnesium transporter
MIRMLVFDGEGHEPRKDVALGQAASLMAEGKAVVWIDLEKPGLGEAREVLEGVFHFHPLAIEDCIEPGSAPKVEEYEPGREDKFAPHLFIVVHAVDYSRRDGKFATSELNLFLGKNFLVTYHDAPLRPMAQAEERLGREPGRAGLGADWLAHLLLDALVENYKPALDELSAEVSSLEERALQASPGQQIMNEMVGLKKEVWRLTRTIGPQSDVLERLASGDFKLIRPRLLPYYRDVSDDLEHIAQMAHGYADALTGIMQISLSLSSNQTGDVVKILTLITVLTTPLMMIGTWYGMNFKDMPELQWAHGYVVAAAAMLLSTGATYWYFRKKKWF